jgi:hypothetical protein
LTVISIKSSLKNGADPGFFKERVQGWYIWAYFLLEFFKEGCRGR